MLLKGFRYERDIVICKSKFISAVVCEEKTRGKYKGNYYIIVTVTDKDLICSRYFNTVEECNTALALWFT